MGRAGQKSDPNTGPERKCIATGEVQPKSGLIRFVVGPDGALVPDIMGKLPGRGIWVAATRAAMTKAIEKGLFKRAAKKPVTLPDGLLDQVDALIARRIVDLISLARKSGDAVAGYEKVKDWLIKDRAAVLIQASDGSDRGKSKLSTPDRGAYIGWLSGEELGLAFGRQTVIHAALGAGGLSARVVEEAARLKGLRLADAPIASRRKGMKS